MGGLDASKSSVATLPAADSAGRNKNPVTSIPVRHHCSLKLPSGHSCSQPSSFRGRDVEFRSFRQRYSTSSSSSVRASERKRKAPARYESPVRHSVREVEESAASFLLPAPVPDNSQVTRSVLFSPRNVVDSSLNFSTNLSVSVCILNFKMLEFVSKLYFLFPYSWRCCLYYFKNRYVVRIFCALGMSCHAYTVYNVYTLHPPLQFLQWRQGRPPAVLS